MLVLGAAQLKSDSYIMLDLIAFTNLRRYPEANNKQHTHTASGFIHVPRRRVIAEPHSCFYD